MAWPNLIQLYDAQNSTAYNGSELRATWYIEPYDAIPSFIASMLGRVDVQGTAPVRTLPAQHFLYPWCLAVQCDDLPLDQRQFSYRGTAALDAPLQGARLAQTNRVTKAVKTLKSSTEDIDTAGFMSADNEKFSAGGFVVVTYQPFLFARSSRSGNDPIASADMDFVNMRYEDQERKNVPNEGLKLINPPNAANLFGFEGLFYPAAGIAPEFKEQYETLIIERRMLNPDFDLSQLAAYQNLVDGDDVTFPSGKIYKAETLRFQKYKTEYVQVPAVNDQGNVEGYSRWLNLTLAWDWRVQKSMIVCNRTGHFNATDIITWNHVLAYPGTLSWLLGGGGIAWYYCKFSANNIGVDTPAYPLVGEVLGGVSTIDDPLTINP